ncbi:MAG TPA: SUMF1/EgtB/PvdO family nonheme iron enzyme [Poseidonia sp.]|nr:SUMF1/EgtB/PvdO family nonheme iron enzyme [Poseidonia sp.]
MDGERPAFTDSWGGVYRLIEPGKFTMGDLAGVGSRLESPAHDVLVTEPFFLGERVTTQAQWMDLMGSNPSIFQEGWSAGLRPVESISFHDAMEFVNMLNQRDGETERLGMIGLWRLPSEAEWEYAARCGTGGRWWFGDRDVELNDYGWHAGNAGSSTKEVGLKKPNPWGIFDMNGLVAEWCADHWSEDYKIPRTQRPFVLPSCQRRVTRGGSWFTESDSTRSSARSSSHETKISDGIGIRLVWEPQSTS